MEIRQLTIFMDNRPGRLLSITSVLVQAGVNLRALSIADSTDFGLLRIIVDDVDKASAALSEAGLVVKVNQVVAVEVPDKPGGLNSILGQLAFDEINIEYIYAFASGEDKEKALVLFKFNDNAKAISILKKQDVRLLSEDDIRKL